MAATLAAQIQWYLNRTLICTHASMLAHCAFGQIQTLHDLRVQVETRIHCPLSAMQTFWYRRLLLKDSAMLKSLEAEVTKDGGVQVTGHLLL